MQVNVHLTFDLGTAAGREAFQRLPQLVPMAGVLASVSDPDGLNVAEKQEAANAKPPANRLQAAAANARAAKAAKAAAAAQTPASAEPEPAPADVAGPADTVEDQGADDLGLTAPAMSPAEAIDEALALCREIYSAGKVAEIKALQKEYGVQKFYDVPVTRGHEFYRRVMQVAQQAGLRQ